jgi:hypothetical protein
MGQVKKVLFETTCGTPMLNERLTVELCENVHLHYRNLRLEFPKEEFLKILQVMKGLDEKEIEDYEYGDNRLKTLFEGYILPKETEFNDRLILEEQVGGHYHLHYRNLRVEHE